MMGRRRAFGLKGQSEMSDDPIDHLMVFDERNDPSHPPIIDDEVSFVPSKGWAEMMPSDRSYFVTKLYGT